MSDHQTHGVLPQMISIVLDYLDKEKLELREDSFFWLKSFKVFKNKKDKT